MKQFAIIGCGLFGKSVALKLVELGHEVIAIDIDEAAIDLLADKVSHAVIADVTVDGTLADIGVSNVDVVIISMSSSLQASILSTIQAKDLGVKTVIAKVKDKQQARVLKKLGADRVIIPEEEMGIRLAHDIASENIFDYIELSSEFTLLEFAIPKAWWDKTIQELKIREHYGVNVVAVKTGEEIAVNPRPNLFMKKGDIAIVIGRYEDIKAIEEMTHE